MNTAETSRDRPPADAVASRPDSIADVEERFRAHLQDRVRGPILAELERYGDALQSIVSDVRQLARSTQPDDPRSRHEYADRFIAAFRADLLERAEAGRETVFQRLERTTESGLDLPETVTTGAADPTAAAADPLVRPRLPRRLLDRLRKPEQRDVPAAELGRIYLAELARRLEPAAARVARLGSVALVLIRRQLHEHTEPDPTDEPYAGAEGGLEAGLAAATAEVEAAVAAVGDAFSRALRAPGIRVDPDAVPELLVEADRDRERVLRGFRSFEEALHANTAAEAVLARAVASLDLAARRAADELDQVLEARGRQPLDRLARGLRSLAGEAAARLDEGSVADAIAPLRVELAGLFDAELPGAAGPLRSEIEEVTARFLEAVARVPESVPDGLRISEERTVVVPERPIELELRDAPLDDLLRAACRGALPRWIERALVTTVEEVDALRQELLRVRNAVDFHVRAPLRGEFGRAEATALVVESTERAASQLEEFRETGFDAIERLISELERRTADEADAVRSAVADREFLRIRSEIAEEQAVRHLATGREWAQRLVVSGLRIARRGWSGGRRLVDRTQGWAERQLGVGALEREEMLESLEESLLGEVRQVPIPGLYRQLFDVEGEVPWEELLVERDEELDTLRRAVGRWRRGQSAAVAIVGEKGSGKTTLLRMSDAAFGDATVRTVRLDGTVFDPAELLALLARALDLSVDGSGALAAALREEGPAVVVLEDAHRLFIRALGGFAAMEAFLELLAATRPEVLWVVTMDEYAWRYLDRVLGLAPHFTHVINTTNLPPEKLERAVMARHDVSGFGLRFELEESPVAAPSRWQRLRKQEAQGELSRRELERRTFFRQLNQIAEGNIFLALFYWLRSVTRVDDHDLVLRSPEIIQVEFLERLPLPSLHTIAGIILHGGLSESEHRRIFHLSPAESRLQIASLADAHLIFRSADDEYRVNKVLYRPLIRLLEARNIF